MQRNIDINYLNPQTTIPPSQVWSPKSPLLVGIVASNLVTKLDLHSYSHRQIKGPKYWHQFFLSFSKFFEAYEMKWNERWAGTEREQELESFGELWWEEPVVHINFRENRDPFRTIFNARMLIWAKKQARSGIKMHLTADQKLKSLFSAVFPWC